MYLMARSIIIGAILLHENNCWHKQLESVTKFKIHHTKKNKMREMKFQIFQNKKSEWNQIQKTRITMGISLLKIMTK